MHRVGPDWLNQLINLGPSSSTLPKVDMQPQGHEPHRQCHGPYYLDGR